VSSLNGDANHAIAPPYYHCYWQAVKTTLLEIIENIPHAAVVENHNEYVHAIFQSKIFSLVDDVGIVFDDKHKVIHLRSAARLGCYDFLVNRQRIEMLRARLTG